MTLMADWLRTRFKLYDIEIRTKARMNLIFMKYLLTNHTIYFVLMLQQNDNKTCTKILQ